MLSKNFLHNFFTKGANNFGPAYFFFLFKPKPSSFKYDINILCYNIISTTLLLSWLL